MTEFNIKVSEKDLIACDQSMAIALGTNEFGHPNSMPTLLARVNNEQAEALRKLSPPVGQQSDGTENMSLRDALDSIPDRTAQTPCEVAADSLRLSSIRASKAADKASKDAVKSSENVPADVSSSDNSDVNS